MTDEEIVARAAWESYREQWSRHAVVPIPDWDHAAQETRDIELTKARAVVAALREAGRLVPDGYVVVSVSDAQWAVQATRLEAQRWPDHPIGELLNRISARMELP